jgi:sugar phosphate isomerase/epimerase
MTFVLGINTCFAVKRWPRPDEWAQIVAEELGLDVVQHSLDLVDLSASDEAVHAQAVSARAACERAGIAIDSIFTGLAAYSSNLMLDPDADARRRAEAFYERAIAFTADLGAARAGGHVGSLSRADAADPARRELLWSELHGALDRLTRVARAAGLEGLLVENMACAREPSRMDEMRDLLSVGDADRVPVELCLDVGHQCVPGTTGEERDPYTWLNRLGDRAAVVHLQQSDAEGDHHWPFTAEFNALGRIRAERVLEALGPARPALILEVIPTFEADDERVLADLKETVAHWRDAAAPGLIAPRAAPGRSDAHRP